MVRKKTAKDTLTEAFRELAAHRPVDRITIREITEKCGYSPATFYRNFRDKYDLIAWEYSREVTRIMNQTGREGCTWKQTLNDGLDYFALQKEYLSNLLLHTGGHDSFVRYMQEINYESLRRYIHGVGGSRLPDKKTDMYIRLYCHGTVILICEWILGKYSVSKETLAEILENSVPHPLHEYLLDE